MKKFRDLCLTLFVIAFTIFVCLIFIVRVIASERTLLQIAAMVDYYEEASNYIVKDLKEIVISKEVREVIDEVINEDRIESDVYSLISSRQNREEDIRNSIKNDFLVKISEDVGEDDEVRELSEILAKNYVSNLFPYNVYAKVTSYIPEFIYASWFIILVVIIYLGVLFVVRFNNNRDVIMTKANYFTSMFLLFVYAFIKCSGIFDNIYYVNEYYSLFIQRLVNYFVNMGGLIGLFILISNLIYQFSRKVNRI